MKKPKTLIFALLFTLFVSSCASTKPPIITQTDSVFVDKTITQIDTVLIAPAAQATLNVGLNQIYSGIKLPLTAQSKQAKITLTQIKKGLVIDCHCDTLAINARLKQVYEKAYKLTVKTPPPIQVKYTPWLTKILAWVGGIAIGIMALLLIYFVTKNRFL